MKLTRSNSSPVTTAPVSTTLTLNAVGFALRAATNRRPATKADACIDPANSTSRAKRSLEVPRKVDAYSMILTDMLDLIALNEPGNIKKTYSITEIGKMEELRLKARYVGMIVSNDESQNTAYGESEMLRLRYINVVKPISCGEP